MNLRDYQVAARDAILRDFESVQSTLCVMPTGTGKTRVVDAVIEDALKQNKRTIFLAHREELLIQARHTFETHAKANCEFEMADKHASEMYPADVILASVQTMISGSKDARRMHKFSPYDYDRLVIDETHHVTSPSYREVVDYFKANEDLKVLGVTATPERADEEALGQIFDSVAFEYSIMEAIDDGWLVPVKQQLIDIQSLDFSHIKTTAGDLNLGELATVMEAERNLYGVCDAAMREIPEGQGIMFTVSVQQAKDATEIFNRYRHNAAVFASGATPKDDRRRIMRQFSDAVYQRLVNCNLVSEGFDVPNADHLIQARPTKSLLLYQQQLGRVMRPLPGIVDEPKFTAADRKAAIAVSKKPFSTVMDFVGNAGRHKLIHAVDVLGGKISERTRELVERKLREGGRPERIDELVIEAEKKEREEELKREAAKRARLTARATYTKTMVDPFDAFGLIAPPSRDWDRSKHLSVKQKALLLKQGMDPERMSYAEGKALLNHQFYRWEHNLCSLKQAALLKSRGIETKDLTREQASSLITEIANREGWRKR